MKRIEVVAGIIYCKNQILCVQRPQNKLHYISEKFEFPGGKIEEGETQKEALHREILEELDEVCVFYDVCVDTGLVDNLVSQEGVCSSDARISRTCFKDAENHHASHVGSPRHRHRRLHSAISGHATTIPDR